jgi:hypothetical protein
MTGGAACTTGGVADAIGAAALTTGAFGGTAGSMVCTKGATGCSADPAGCTDIATCGRVAAIGCCGRIVFSGRGAAFTAATSVVSSALSSRLVTRTDPFALLVGLADVVD